MFENMMKYEKVNIKFEKWLMKNYDIYHNINGETYKYYFYFNIDNNGNIKKIPDDFILSIMPFFFDEYGINIQLSNTPYGWTFFVHGIITDEFLDRKNCLSKACEKAFEILENKLN